MRNGWKGLTRSKLFITKVDQNKIYLRPGSHQKLVHTPETCAGITSDISVHFRSERADIISDQNFPYFAARSALREIST